MHAVDRQTWLVLAVGHFKTLHRSKGTQLARVRARVGHRVQLQFYVHDHATTNAQAEPFTGLSFASITHWPPELQKGYTRTIVVLEIGGIDTLRRK